MAQYIVGYQNTGTTPHQVDQAKAAFAAWIASLGPAITNPHQPLHAAGISNGGSPTHFSISGPTILQAADEQAARTLIAAHPIHTPSGGTITIRPHP